MIPVAETGQGWWSDLKGVAGTVRDASGGGASHANLVASTGETSHCLNAGGMGRIDYETETLVVGALTSKHTPNGHGMSGTVATRSAVRRLTPLECERLQGFPDSHTDIGRADGPRYTALGNSMAVPVIRYIGERISASLNRL